MLEEKSKILRRLVDQVPFLRDRENFRIEFVGYWKDIFRGYKSVEAACLILSKLTNLEKKFKTERVRKTIQADNSSESGKQTL